MFIAKPLKALVTAAIWLALAGASAVCWQGCSSIRYCDPADAAGLKYDPADAIGDPADISGWWIVPDAFIKNYFIEKKGDRVTLKYFYLGNELTENGILKGRVCIILNFDGKSHRSITFAPDLKTGIEKFSVSEATYLWRIAVGVASSEHTETAKNPYLRGGIVITGFEEPILCLPTYVWMSEKSTYGEKETHQRALMFTTLDALGYHNFLSKEKSSKMHYPRCEWDKLWGNAKSRIVTKQVAFGSSSEWLSLSPLWSLKPIDACPDAIVCEFFAHDPNKGFETPTHTAIAALRGKADKWTVVNNYHFPTEAGAAPFRIRPVFENGVPVNIEITKIALISVSEFGDLLERSETGLLLRLKNEYLAAVLRESKTAEIAALMTRIEAFILTLNGWVEKANDKAQEAQASGKPAEVEAHRDLSRTFKDRLEVLKGALAAVKEEVANRQK